MSATQQEKANRFRALHDGPGAFVIPNPWDVGSARMLAGLGFAALATSSAAAAEAALSLPFPFMLTARAHNFLYPNRSLDETIRRLQAFEKAGASVLFAPGLPDLAAVRTVCAAVSKPFNFMAGIPGNSFPVEELAAAGVRRISLATSLYRAAMTGFLQAAREVKETGRFGFLDRSVSTAELNRLMGL